MPIVFALEIDTTSTGSTISCAFRLMNYHHSLIDGRLVLTSRHIARNPNTTGATLNARGQQHIETAKQAAEALRSLAGPGAYWLFTLGIIGTGMLAVPVLVGSCAYAIAEGAKWKDASLNLQAKLAPKFYAVIAVSILVGLAFDFARINAVKMLFWSAILNGLLAPPLVIMVVLLTSDRKVMGNQVNSPKMKVLGWTCAIVMSAAAIALVGFSR
jgi:Mn2+/Fe2+ NRAMP family transporter